MLRNILSQSFHRSKLFSHAKSISRGTLCRLQRHLGNQNRRTQPGQKLTGFTERGYILLVVPIVTFYLGIWQLKRKKWKENLIKQLDDTLTNEPVPLPEFLEELEKMELQPVVVHGEFDYTHEAYIGPKSHSLEDSTHTASKRGGVHVVTPFKLSDRDLTIMINRGWLDSKVWENEETRKAAQVHGPRTVVGSVRLNQEEHGFVKHIVDTKRINEKRGLRYFNARHLDLLAEECHAAPVYLDALDEQMAPGAPLGVRPARDLRNDHWHYAMTWFSIAFISMYYWARKFSRPLRPAEVRRSLGKREAVRHNRRK